MDCRTQDILTPDLIGTADMSMRVFSLNATIPVLAACDVCGIEIRPRRHRDASGNQWVSGEELIQLWMDHQLIDCKPPEGGEQ